MCIDSLRRWLAGPLRIRAEGTSGQEAHGTGSAAHSEGTETPDGVLRLPQSLEALPPLPVETPDGIVAERVAVVKGMGLALGGVPIAVALRNQVLRFSVPRRVGLSAAWAFRQRPTGPYAMHDEGSAARLAPRLRPWPRFVGAGELVVKAKAFDDGLLAAVELASQEPCGPFAGKRPLLRGLREKLASGGSAASLIDAACDVGGLGAVVSPGGRHTLDRFLADDLRAKPIGFYTWTEELSRIFRQDRILQGDLAGSDDARAVAALLAGTRGLLNAYSQCLRLAERCTNRLTCADFRAWAESIAAGLPQPPLTQAADGALALFPASRAHETDLARRLYGFRPIPEGADLLREVIQAVRGGEIDLRPGHDSGWYDWQTWALETLVATERAEEAGRVVLEDSYRAHLEDLFRAALALGRETHVKQLETIPIGAALSPPLEIAPHLRLEPLVTHYARRAEGYRYIRGALRELLGESTLDTLFRLRPDGASELPLSVELDFMVALFDGAADVARLELGMSAKGATDEFVRWMKSRGGDPDLTSDLRSMVPVTTTSGAVEPRSGCSWGGKRIRSTWNSTGRLR